MLLALRPRRAKARSPRALPGLAPCALHVLRRYAEAGQYIQEYRKGQLKLQPGCNAEQSLEASVTGVLNNIREAAAKVGSRLF